MTPKRAVLALLLSIFVGNLAGVEIVRTPKVCVPCTPYCKLHPNSPRCN